MGVLLDAGSLVRTFIFTAHVLHHDSVGSSLGSGPRLLETYSFLKFQSRVPLQPSPARTRLDIKVKLRSPSCQPQHLNVVFIYFRRMAGISLCDPTQLYNILNQSTDYPNVSDVEYLLLIDARDWQDYSKDHIVLALRARKDSSGKFEVPYGADIETKLHIIVYDSNTSLLTDKGPAIAYAKLLAEGGSQQPVSVLKGGYERFTALYPFLRTQKILYTNQELDKFETCPIEVLPQLLYIGLERQAANSHMMMKMKITGLVCCKPQDRSGSSLPQFHVPVSDTADASILEHIEKTCDFIGDRLKLGGRVLVYGQYGRSRSATVIIAFLMKHHKWSLELAYRHVLRCCQNIRPNRAFIQQLSEWEKRIHGETQTDISDPNY